MTEQAVELKEQWTDGLFEFLVEEVPNRKQHSTVKADSELDNVAPECSSEREGKIEEGIGCKEYYNSGDEVEFILKGQVFQGVVKGFLWKPGTPNHPEPDKRPTKITEPADTLAIKVEGKKSLINIPNTNVIKLISCALNPLIVTRPSGNNENVEVESDYEEDYDGEDY
ncbi:hypothetical protein MZM54_03550 [[Brevibacterium] frigoritolerans]|nr:hypothetical protein [Peribacillus frigoritolerans]